MAEALWGEEAGAVPPARKGGGGGKNAWAALRLWIFVALSIAGAIVFREDGRLIVASVIGIALALIAVPAGKALFATLFRKAQADDSEERDDEATGQEVQEQLVRASAVQYDYEPTLSEQLRQTLVLTALQLWVLAALAVVAATSKFDLLEREFSIWVFFSVFGFAILAPLVSFGVEAVKAEKLPPRPGDMPEHKHITGFGALALLGIVVGIIVLATWAATDRQVNSRIHAEWGAWIVYALVLAFVLIAVAPGFSIPGWLVRGAEISANLLRPFGRALSVIDSLLVYCVAPATGATLRRRWVARYAYLAAYMAPLGLMGYWLPAPLGLVPIAWALIAAVAISRRWAWVEDDRETAMLTAQFRSENLRVGFSQDLRDEALLAFVSMFFLLPLALRQGHEWGAAHDAAVFTIKGIDTDNLFHWIQYFGGELAKAVPFVDWAEIYNVEGAGPIEMKSTVAQHVVFATRVLVDLVLLAALLQALSTLARNAKQIELFADGVVDRFDPFMEKAEFQKIVTWENGGWAPKSPEFDRFARRRKYSLIRLLELTEEGRGRRRFDARTPDCAVLAAASFLYDRDYRGANVVAELYGKLRDVSGLAAGKAPNKDAVADILDELERIGLPFQIEDLNDMRVHLNKYASAWRLRQRIIGMIAAKIEDTNSEDYSLQVSALALTFTGPKDADSRADNRRAAFEGLKPAYLLGDRTAVKAVQRAAKFDKAAAALRKEIAAFVAQNPRSAGPEPDETAPMV